MPYRVQMAGRTFGMPLSLAVAVREPLLVRLGEGRESAFLGLAANRGRPDHPMLLSPASHSTHPAMGRLEQIE